VLTASGAAQLQVATDGSQCDLLTDLLEDGTQVSYLQAIFRSQRADNAYDVVNFTIRPYAGTNTYAAIGMPSGTDVPSSEPRLLKNGASMRLSRFSPGGTRQDWAPTSGQVVVGGAETGTLSGSMKVDLEIEGKPNHGSGGSQLHLDGTWKCTYLKDPQAHF
jgi:hypothetical protein